MQQAITRSTSNTKLAHTLTLHMFGPIRYQIITADMILQNKPHS